ncbi:tRNA synthetases class I (E and q), catalytic domain-containing protein [Ditylenchus destructor]|uniref:tRNA synthetases class I (E and q), catalytic domain-containing protein n=1 Tax=Ditylenchus destructor TaxID=166010 RepID=A0AAD4MI25_9BILA|nr:tRNA synthetases class I (E and q), catalytic domain-containing protein [Ditylenchus destructor]
MAASSCSASRIPIAPARPTRRSRRSSTGCAGLASIGMVTRFISSPAPNRHAEVAHAMLESGHAYRCWMSQEEIAAQREEAQAAKKPIASAAPGATAPTARSISRTSSASAPRERARRRSATRCRAKWTVQNAELDDMILLRSDGTPTYMLAVVVDDHDMGVTHVIRGDDHLNNAFRQLLIIHAMDWAEPVYAHIPLIHGADGAKLSKRHGALGVDGIATNWACCPRRCSTISSASAGAHGDDEIIDRAQAVEWFDLSGVGKSPRASI